MLERLGVDLAVDYSSDDWSAQVLDGTGGTGADVVFDGVGGAIGRGALEATAPGGRFSVHGAASGEVTVVDPVHAAERGVEVMGIEQLFGFPEHSVRWAAEVMSAAIGGRAGR